MKLNEELQKLFRTISNYAWALNDEDLVNDTNMLSYYTNDLINYFATGDATLSTIATAEANDPDAEPDSYAKVKSMFVNTVELINDFKEKMDQIENKANRNKII